MKPVQLEDNARQELFEAYIWYESKQLGLGDDFLQEANRIVTMIQAKPAIGTPIEGSTVGQRKMRLKRFKFYSIVYQDEPTAIVIVSIFHGSRNPDQPFFR